MKHYIDKDALAAEIERRVTFFMKEAKKKPTSDDSSCAVALYGLLSFLDTLKVKEIGVDVGSHEGDWSSKTVQFIDADGNIKEITFNKAQKGE